VDQPRLKIVLVVLMRGNTFAVRGPIAAGIAGRIYHQLHADEYFTKQATDSSVETVATQSGK
jgi:hypothetical protein